MAKFSSSLSNVNLNTVLIIIVIALAVIVVVYFLNEKKECFAWHAQCPFQGSEIQNGNAVPATCITGDTCGYNNRSWECQLNANGGTQWNQQSDDEDPTTLP